MADADRQVHAGQVAVVAWQPVDTVMTDVYRLNFLEDSERSDVKKFRQVASLCSEIPVAFITVWVSPFQ